MLPYLRWLHTSRDQPRGASSILDDGRWLCHLETAGTEMGSHAQGSPSPLDQSASNSQQWGQHICAVLQQNAPPDIY